MIDNYTLTKEKITLCEHSTVTDDDDRTEYYLYSIITASGKEYYAIEIGYNESFAFSVIGDEHESARKLYLQVVDGRVNGITLDDIIHDLKMSKNY